MTLAYLSDRGVIEIGGADRIGFLQGLVSNDVEKVAQDRAVWAALLTPQGRYLAEFFIFDSGSALLLDSPRAAIADMIKRLSRFRLRSAVTIADRSEDYAVHAGWDGSSAPADAIAAPDPRLAEAGWRRLARDKIAGALTSNAYLVHRLALGLPDHADLEPEKTLLMEAGFGELHGIDWDKGCYMGQELTARTRYRGLVKRRLVPVSADAELPHSGTITDAERDVGDLRCAVGRRGLAMLRLNAIDRSLRIGPITVTPDIPKWLTLPASSEKATA